jgi:hypothetical protein
MSDQRVNLVISPSGLTTFEVCTQLFDYAHNQRLVSVEANFPKDFGIYTHTLLETYYNIIKSGENWGEALKLTRAKHERDYLQADGVSVEIHHKALDKLFKYANYWKAERWRPLEVEKKFSIIIYEDDYLRIIIEGKIDLIVEQGMDDIIVVDHKTGQAREHPALDNAPFAYCLATDRRVFVYNILATKDGPANKVFDRQVCRYTKSQLEEWTADVVDHGKRMVQHLAENRWPKVLTGCTRFGKCDFYRVCYGPPEGRQYILDNFFKKGKPHDLFEVKK